MSTKNKKVTASDILMDYDKMQAQLKEESKKTIAALLAESVKNGLNDAIEDEDDEEYEITDEDSTENEVDDDEASEAPEVDDENSDEEFESDGEDDEESDFEPEGDDEESDDEESDGEWSEFDKYKVDDDTYDLSGEEDDAAVIKVYKLLKDSDKVVVKKEGNRAEIKDAETGAEYVIDFGDENPEVEKVDDGFEDESDDMEDDEMELNENQLADLDLDNQQDAFEGEESNDLTPEEREQLEMFRNGGEPEDDEIDFEDEDESINAEGEDLADGGMEMLGNDDDIESGALTNEGRKSRKTMNENKQKVLFEVDLGYTDNYQDKDPIEGLSDAEPSKGKSEWGSAGAPKGTKKPWAGKGDSAPFDKQVNEEFDEMGEEPMDDVEGDSFEGEDANLEENVTTSKSAHRRSSKTKGPKDAHKVKGTRHHSSGSEYKDLEESVKKLQKENKMLKEAALKIKAGLQEAILVNVNLGQVVRILQENSTTTEEKNNIIARFNNVKSINESKALYESVTRELAGAKREITLESKTMTATPAKQINESTVYENPGLAEIRNMMNRIDNARI